ncbi:MAG: tRNA(fMet)-specific endonuclease VapC [Candidatus Brocadia sinica]|uniref:Ribonuclease VapC n=1 Tax=Candidatus Brocadia sinica JPN1 TaxID=1197129 RepID=A0ABQ0JYG3_9BACT|nr:MULTISPECIES: type II toxin-antitoxin system VapC family toxin [Brocadia]KXK25185.1 MAG: tRNA(fMet)-specific endonuclease VapC [Candidatus Brocadia sinica]NOG40424.1 type II toxin-antitoxin system VapC family toxin [Planctomycetota bacterium]MCK6467663.1 type II toxin-antitoxin system VapC family toxin [Candidatus Brocadia sinica]NUO06604.1 type II toxin-antitoxin system VapC family toxin [Candidatus Brocadia sinica]GAN33777.1 nucleic-acid-binding protein contains PIN domain [Candidatus Bro
MERTEKVVIDTNLLVRYLINDDQKKAEAVDNLLDKAMKGEVRIVVPSVVIAELVWVLESFYQMKADTILELVEAIVNTTGLDVTDKLTVISALRLYKNRNIDFIDAWIIEFAKERGIKTIYTFDKKHFRDIEGIEVAIL